MDKCLVNKGKFLGFGLEDLKREKKKLISFERCIIFGFVEVYFKKELINRGSKEFILVRGKV